MMTTFKSRYWSYDGPGGLHLSTWTSHLHHASLRFQQSTRAGQGSLVPLRNALSPKFRELSVFIAALVLTPTICCGWLPMHTKGADADVLYRRRTR